MHVYFSLVLLFFFSLSVFCGEQIPHECGVAFVRLRKPISYYSEKYKDSAWGMNKLLSLMENQLHRGQDGAGIAVLKLHLPPGNEFLHHLKFSSKYAFDNLCREVSTDHEVLSRTENGSLNELSLKLKSKYLGEILLGHLRYATHSGLDLKYCQPFVYTHAKACKNLAFAGNFNMTNTEILFNHLHDLGITPTSASDTQILAESFVSQLEKEYEDLNAKNSVLKVSNELLTTEKIDIVEVLRKTAVNWDGGYVFCCILGNGDAFVCRDPAGIRPGYYYLDEEVFAVASERIALIDAFQLNEKEVLPIEPGHVIVINQNGDFKEDAFTKRLPQKECLFERIYFSKASDPAVYNDRKALGRRLAQRVYEAIDGDIEHAIFAHVPHSSYPAFQGLVEEISGIHARKNSLLLQKQIESGEPHWETVQKIASSIVKTELLVNKKHKIRTFISTDQFRSTSGPQVYDVMNGNVTEQDTLVVVDDSIVRGTTLRDFLMTKLIQLNPKKIIVISSAPPVLYPDCYGIDISQLGRFVAFQAALSVLKEQKREHLLEEIYQQCLQQNKLASVRNQNFVQKIYASMSLDAISTKVATLITPPNSLWKGKVEVIFQTVEDLQKAIPHCTGDWYFTGDYPTPGGYKVLNTAYINWYEGCDQRSY